MNPLRLALPALLLPTLLLPVVTVAPATAAADDLCFGQAPTVVGAPGQSVTGTDGPDVIVATDSRQVRGLGGDDSICIIGAASRVTAGDGADRVDALRSRLIFHVSLGSGADTFLGGPSSDEVNTGDLDDVHQGLPVSTDDISTGGGDDTVITGAGRGDTEFNNDSIVLGSGRDEVRVRGSSVPPINGGLGDDELAISSTAGGDWVLDAPAGVVSRDAIQMGPMTSMSEFVVTRLSWDHLTVTGGDASETLELGGGSGRVKGDGPIEVDLGAGDDTVLAARSQDTGSLDGGSGFDSLSLDAARTTSRRTSLLLDLPRGVLRLTGGDPLRLEGWGRIYVDQADRSTFVGDALANQLIVFGCHNTIRGGGGNDVLTAFPGDGACAGFALAARGVDINGGPGNDKLEGTYFRDHLVGGPGRDVAYGATGGDRCDAEVEKECGR